MREDLQKFHKNYGRIRLRWGSYSITYGRLTLRTEHWTRRIADDRVGIAPQPAEMSMELSTPGNDQVGSIFHGRIPDHVGGVPSLHHNFQVGPCISLKNNYFLASRRDQGAE